MKLLKNHILNFSWFYGISRWPISLAFLFFYKKYIVTGKENVPRDKPVLLAPNHQNAALDAYAVITSLPFCQPVFLARADVFKKPAVAWILQMIKILPVYRERDGTDSLEKNNEIFNLAIEVLEKKKVIGIFPEGRHNNSRFLLPLKKGVPRVAFTAEEKNNFNLGLQIVPVGIYYDNYENSNSVLQVNYGKPIAVSSYRELYIQNPPKAMLTLRNDLEKAIKPLMIDIRNRECNDQYELLRYVFNRDMRKHLGLGCNQQDRFMADKEIILTLDRSMSGNAELFEKIMAMTREYQAVLSKGSISDRVVECNDNIGSLMLKTVWLLLFSPVFLYGYINSILPVIPPKLLVRKIRDKQFHSSVKFVMSLILFPVFYLLQTLVVYKVSGSALICLAYFFSLFSAVNIYVGCRAWYGKLIESWRFFFLRKTNLATALMLRHDIINLLDDAYSKTKL